MKHEDAGKSFRPSNGSDGMNFVDKHCMNCINCDPNPNGKKQCNILAASMGYSVGDKLYPKEWVYDDNGKGSCTAYTPWNWKIHGNPDNPSNPNYVQKPDPNQIKMEL